MLSMASVVEKSKMWQIRDTGNTRGKKGPAVEGAN